LADSRSSHCSNGNMSEGLAVRGSGTSIPCDTARQINS